MADHYSLCLLTVMDRLWFHQIILFSSSDSSSLTHNSILQHQQTPSPSPLPPQQIPLTDSSEEEERPTRSMNPTRCRRSHSSSTMERWQLRNIPRSSSMREIEQKKYSVISCRSLRELEMEEVKGFIDLGFKFNKENMNPRMAIVVPGLLKFFKSDLGKSDDEKEEEDEDIVKDDNEEEGGGGIIRPYLSEAWLIRRPNSPLLNFKLPVGGVSDMKEHLKFWARTVATVIQQES